MIGEFHYAHDAYEVHVVYVVSLLLQAPVPDL
jgi:hypothetical protein